LYLLFLVWQLGRLLIRFVSVWLRFWQFWWEILVQKRFFSRRRQSEAKILECVAKTCDLKENCKHGWEMRPSVNTRSYTIETGIRMLIRLFCRNWVETVNYCCDFSFPENLAPVNTTSLHICLLTMTYLQWTAESGWDILVV